MLSPRDRCQIRAALALWKAAVEGSGVHPSELPACKAVFITDGFLPISETRLDALMMALEMDLVFATVTPSAKRYGMSKLRLKRELDRIQAIPVPGTAIYNLTDIIYAVNRIRARDKH